MHRLPNTRSLNLPDRPSRAVLASSPQMATDGALRKGDRGGVYNRDGEGEEWGKGDEEKRGEG